MSLRPYTLIAELTYRCPLGCPYCSNPQGFASSGDELSAGEWQRVFREAEALGAVQVHLTGGEPLLRSDLELVVAYARELGLYTNLVTSGVPHDAERWGALARAGIEHVQLSLQGPEAEVSDRIAGRRAFAEKLAAARAIRERGLPLTLNVVLSRENIELLDELPPLALALGASRLELAHAQYHGLALENRAALMPTFDAVERARRRVARVRRLYAERLEIAHVLPDYHAGRPKACMDGWGRRYLNVTPDGFALPCHAARSIPGLVFENVRLRSLAAIWHESSSFNAFRGESWMKEPCRSCERRYEDFGGCRCQAFALTGDARAADPACSISPDHELVLAARRLAERDQADSTKRRYLYRSPRSGATQV